MFGRAILSLVLTASLILATGSPDAFAGPPSQGSASQAPATPQNPPTNSTAPSEQDLEQLVAPIALYPDALVAQILAGSTYPTQVVEADRWLKQNPNLKGDQLAAEVDKQPWDPSIKGLTQFPSVLDNMNKNLSWTSALGDAYFNDQQAVMNAIQVMRKKAQDAGNLKSTSQQTVATEKQTIIIEPANPQVVYVPTYSPAVVYGSPVPVYPGYSGWDVAAASMISFGVGVAVGAAFSHPWGWGGWNCGWHGGTVVYNRNVYVSNSSTFVNRNTRYTNVNNINRTNVNNVNRTNVNNVNRNNVNDVSRNNLNSANRNNINRNNVNGANRQNFNANRGYGQASSATAGTKSSAFGGYGQGGAARANSARGASSVRGGGGGRR